MNFNRTPKLCCAGGCGVTEHEYTKEIRHVSAADKSTKGYEQIFSCSNCGKSRRYGMTASSYCAPPLEVDVK